MTARKSFPILSNLAGYYFPLIKHNLFYVLGEQFSALLQRCTCPGFCLLTLGSRDRPTVNHRFLLPPDPLLRFALLILLIRRYQATTDSAGLYSLCLSTTNYFQFLLLLSRLCILSPALPHSVVILMIPSFCQLLPLFYSLLFCSAFIFPTPANSHTRACPHIFIFIQSPVVRGNVPVPSKIPVC